MDSRRRLARGTSRPRGRSSMTISSSWARSSRSIDPSRTSHRSSGSTTSSRGWNRRKCSWTAMTSACSTIWSRTPRLVRRSSRNGIRCAATRLPQSGSSSTRAPSSRCSIADVGRPSLELRLAASLPALHLGGLRALLEHGAQLDGFLAHALDVFLERPPPLPFRGVSVGRVHPARDLARLEGAVGEGGRNLPSPVRRVVHLPEALQERHDRRDPAAEDRHVFAPLDLEAPSLVLADLLEPGPRLVQGASHESRVAVQMGQLGIRIRRQLEETVVRPAPKRLALRARVVQESHERLRVRSRGRRGDPDSAPLAALQQEGDRDVRAGARQEVQVSCRGRRVEPIHAVVERLRLLRRGRRFGDLLQPLGLGLQVPHTGLDAAESLPVLGLEPSDFGALLPDLVELPPRASRTVEVPPPRFPKGHVKDRDEPQRETLVLRSLREVRGDGLDVPREDPHLSPVVDLAIPDQAIDPFAEAIQRAVEDPRDALDFLPRAGDRFEQAGSLGFEGRGGRRVGRRHEDAAMEARTYLASFGRRSKPLLPPSSYPLAGDAGPWRS